jgi:glycerophosphoryl diester phosphodiesterase
LEELRKLDVGSWKDPKYRGEKIPTLAEMLAAIPAGKSVFIEVKCGPEIVPQLVTEITASKIEAARLPVIAFDKRVIAAFKAARPDHPAYWLVGLDKKDQPAPTAESLIETVREIKADGLDLSATKSLDAEYAAKILKAQLKLFVYTVNDPAVARRMVEIGVHGITTDRPAWLREQLKLQR